MRFGIVGSGGMGETWLEVATRGVEGASATALWGGSQAPALAARAGIPAERSLDALLARPDVDGVVVATPIETHAEYAIAAARAGKHVFLEKPMSTSVAEADAIIAATRAAGVTLGVVSQHRFRPSPMATHQAIRAGRIGALRMVDARGALAWPDYRRDRAPWFELGAHLVDLLRWLVGSEPVAVSARFATFGAPAPNPQTGVATFEFEDGVLARVLVTFELPRPGLGSQVEYLVVGSEGTIALDSYAQARLISADGSEVLAEQPQGDPNDPFDPVRLESYQRQLTDFVAAVREGRAPEVDGRAGRTTIAMLEAALRSDREGRRTAIDRGPVATTAVTSAPLTGAAYAQRVLSRLDRIAHETRPAIERAGALIADALAGGGRIWVAQTSHYLHTEATHRAGGLVAVHVLDAPEQVSAGDAVLIGITAGASTQIVDLALALQARGAKVVALTQLDFERDPVLAPAHPRGTLADVADLHVDIGGPFGDGEAELRVPGASEPVRILPSSGVTSLLALWMILADAVGRLTARGLVPLVYESNLLPGARERNEAREERYRETGRGVEVAS